LDGREEEEKENTGGTPVPLDWGEEGGMQSRPTAGSFAFYNDSMTGDNSTDIDTYQVKSEDEIFSLAR